MLCIHIYFIWVLYLPLNLCLSMPTKSRHISLKCQFYSVCECLSVCKCGCVCALRMWRHHKNEQEHHRNGIAIKYIMKTWMVYIKCDIRMKWMTNDLWRSISSRFLVFASILYITLPTRFNSLFFFPLYSSFAIFHFAIKLYHCYCIYTIYVHLRIFRLQKC